MEKFSSSVDTRAGRSKCWLVDGDVDGNGQHGNGTTSGSDHENLPSSHLVDQEEDPEQGGAGLDDTKDTGSEETSVGTSDSQGLEDGGRVVVDGVDTSSVLEGKER